MVALGVRKELGSPFSTRVKKAFGWFFARLSAISELETDEEWALVEGQLQHRHDTLVSTVDRLEAIIDKKAKLACAAVDVLVEKAQLKLSRRGRNSLVNGAACALLTVGTGRLRRTRTTPMRPTGT